MIYWRPCSRNDSHNDALAHIEQMRRSVVSILVAVSIQLGWAIQPVTSLHDDIFDQSTYVCSANISLFVSVPQSPFLDHLERPPLVSILEFRSGELCVLGPIHSIWAGTLGWMYVEFLGPAHTVTATENVRTPTRPTAGPHDHAACRDIKAIRTPTHRPL